MMKKVSLDACENKVPAKTEQKADSQATYITGEEVDLRQIAVQYMYDMAKIEWTAGSLIDYSFNNKSLVYQPGEKYLGMIFNCRQTGMEAFKGALDENGRYILEDVDWNTAPGNSCATSVKHAWQQVSPDVEYDYSINMMPYYKETGVLAVGNINWAAYDGKNTTNSILKNTEKKDVLEAYAMALPGDGFMRYLDNGGHGMMITLEPIVVRDENGEIDPEESFVFLTDQNNRLHTRREYPSSWEMDRRVSFQRAYNEGYLPVTTKELQEGKAPVPTFEVTEPPKAEELAVGQMKGTVKCNYCLNTVTAEIRKGGANGEVIVTSTEHPYARNYGFTNLKDGLGLDKLALGKYCMVITGEVGLGSETLVEIEFEKN